MINRLILILSLIVFAIILAILLKEKYDKKGLYKIWNYCDITNHRVGANRIWGKESSDLSGGTTIFG